MHDLSTSSLTAWPWLALFAMPWLVAAGGAWLAYRYARRLRQMATHRDALRRELADAAAGDPAAPGVLSREAFAERLNEVADRADRAGGQFSLLYLDLDGFGAVNDAVGHRRGDEFLREVATRIRRQVDGPVCRIAGDEFAMIVEGDAAQAREVARRLPACMAPPADGPLAGRLAGTALSCSIGIAHYPEHGGRSLLLANAVLAMRSVKLAGGGDFADYEPQMGRDAREEMALLADLRVALERGQLSLFYQPKVDARTLQITAAEALLRWDHPERGMVGPARFIPLAERHGLIGALGGWALEQACRQAAAWREQGLRMRVAVNLSAHQLRQDAMVDGLVDSLKRHGIPPGRFTVEITESVAMEDTRITRDAFDRLRQAGLHVSIDDFGTGYSSLASLRRLPAAELKIDRAFVCDLETSHDARTICEAIVHMAHTIGLRVVAEGVETAGQRDLLVAIGCDELQGYLFARPMSAQALAQWAAMDDAPEAPEFSPSLFDPTRPTDL
ncbi:MAG: bifunctional diguanylate cyclase/phosphodiesterase [Burkholderiales bacterium]|nr:bifunctional diguanylate cyclase/phosphodiesterase [Burkholderiales bacterium]